MKMKSSDLHKVNNLGFRIGKSTTSFTIGHKLHQAQDHSLVTMNYYQRFCPQLRGAFGNCPRVNRHVIDGAFLLRLISDHDSFYPGTICETVLILQGMLARQYFNNLFYNLRTEHFMISCWDSLRVAPWKAFNAPMPATVLFFGGSADDLGGRAKSFQ